MPDTLLIIYGCIALEILAIGTVCFANLPVLAIAGILAAFLMDAITLEPLSIQIGINIYAADAVFVPLAIAAMLRLLALRRLHILHGVIAGLWVLFALSLVRGIGSWGVNLAGVEARGTFYFLTAVLYLSTVPPTRRSVNCIVNLWLLIAALVSLLALFRWVAQVAGVQVPLWNEELYGAGSVSSWRVLYAPHALVLAIAMFICLVKLSSGEAGSRHRWFAVILALQVVLLQHRTVWIVSIVGLAWLLVMDGKLRGKLGLSVAAAALVGSIFYLVFLDNPANPIAVSLQTSATDEGTFEWRLEGWKQLLSNDGRYSIADRLIGQPFGAGFPRIIDGLLVNTSPHNFYIQTVVRLGLFGLVLLLALYVMSFRGLVRRRLSPQPGLLTQSRFWQMLLVMHLFYFIPYAPNYEQGIVIGMISGLVIAGTIESQERLKRIEGWC